LVFRVRPDGVLETLDGAELQLDPAGRSEFFIASGAAARRHYGEQAELRALRLKRVGGSPYKRAGSRFWQIQYFVGGKWRRNRRTRRASVMRSRC
jgi:hypothetical protein